MSIKYHADGKWLELGADRALQTSMPVFLCCPGPSLADVDTDALRGTGRYIAALNTAYPRVKPDIWIGFDMPSCFDRKVWWEPCMKFSAWNWRNERALGVHTKDQPNTFFCDLDDDAHYLTMFDRGGYKVKLAWNMNSFEGALHLLLWLGFRNIFLVGCDFGGKADYHDGRVLDYDRRCENKHLYGKQVGRLAHIGLEAAQRGINIFSCTPESPANEFLQYVPLDEVLRQCESTIPTDQYAPVLHVREAERCLWSVNPKPGRQVIAGCDSYQEWLLEWWYARYRKFNDYPILWVDMGMSEKGKKWCAQRGPVVDVRRRKDLLSYWWLKPISMLRGQYKRLLWVDLDCEILGNLGPFFDAAENGCVGIRPDKHHEPERLPAGMDPETGVIFNSGLMSFEHGHPAIQRWAEAIFDCVRHQGNTDQEPLSLLLCNDYADKTALFDEGMCTLPTQKRAYSEPDRSNTIVRHWVCPEGKDRIKEMIDGHAQHRTIDIPPAALAAPRPKPVSETVIVGLDDAQQWLLPWWHEHYAKHNDYPVVFADFGMSASARSWCEKHGTVVDVKHEGLSAHWLKPLAMLSVTEGKCLWLDLDCEVSASLKPIFDGIEAESLYMHYDDRATHDMGNGTGVYNAGTIGFVSGASVLGEWHNAICSADRSKTKYFDQDILAAIRPNVKSMPASAVRLFTDKDGDCIIYHWLGDGGKKRIRAAIEAKAKKPCKSCGGKKEPALNGGVSICVTVKDYSSVPSEHGPLDLFPQCVASIAKSVSPNDDVEVVIVDWQSTDRPLDEWVQKALGKIPVRIIQMYGEYSTGRGLNAAVQAASKPNVCCIGGDIAVTRSLLTRGLECVADGNVFRPTLLGIDGFGSRTGWWMNNCGVAVVGRKMFLDAGGYAENTTWGGADPPLFESLGNLTGVVQERVQGLVHLWHPECESKKAVKAASAGSPTPPPQDQPSEDSTAPQS